jgi:hypothetical protein
MMTCSAVQRSETTYLAYGAVPRTASRGLCRAAGPIVDASETGDVTASEGNFASVA